MVVPILMQYPPEPLLSWSHVEVVATVLVPFLIFWWDTRRQNQKMHTETQNQNWEMHKENQNRLIALETKLDPIWEWWTKITKGG
jgi:hypothetical protein